MLGVLVVGRVVVLGLVLEGAVLVGVVVVGRVLVGVVVLLVSDTNSVVLGSGATLAFVAVELDPEPDDPEADAELDDPEAVPFSSDVS